MSTAESVEGKSSALLLPGSGEGSDERFLKIVFPVRRAPALPRPARSAVREMAGSAGRRVDPPVRKSFVRPMAADADPVAPMAGVYSGGRSGVVALKLYLALIWRCSAPPFSTDKPARAWATLLNLDDPEGKGTRRIKSAMKTLEAANLIAIEENPGYPNIVWLLDEAGTGRDYRLPSTAYTLAKQNGEPKSVLAEDMYFKVPKRLWTRGYIQNLKGPGLVMLLILLAEQAGEGEKVWFSTAEFPKRYNISHKTRAAGTQELIDLGLLRVESQSLAKSGYSNTFDTRRRRKVYELTPRARTAGPEPIVESGSRKKLRRKPTKNNPKAKRLTTP